MAWNALDYTLLAILLLSVGLGAWRGLLKEVIALAVLVVGVLAAFSLSPPVAAFFQTWFDEPTLCYLLSFFLIFGAVLLAGVALKSLTTWAAHAAGLGILNRLLGTVFGFIRGALISLVLITFLKIVPVTNPQLLEKSLLVPIFEAPVALIESVLPPLPQVKTKAAQIKTKIITRS